MVVAEVRKEQHYEIKAMSQGQQGSWTAEGSLQSDIRSGRRTCGGLHRRGFASLSLFLPPMVGNEVCSFCDAPTQASHTPRQAGRLHCLRDAIDGAMIRS